MISVPVFDNTGRALDPIEVDEARLGGRVRTALLREAVQMYENNAHVCTKAGLSRSEVKGSTRKMYRQKHTGYARAGQRTVPQRRGGGLAFAPKPRDISFHMPRKARKAATQSALLSRLKDGEVALLNELIIDAPKTRRIVELLKALEIGGRCLLVVEGDHTNAWKSGRNVAKLTVRRAADVNAYDLMAPDRVLFTAAAFEQVLQSVTS
jgi:large subunit ribosomal protein L4